MVLLIPALAPSLEVKVQVPDTTLGPFDSVTGTIEILHDSEAEVDTQSFTLDGEPLRIQLISESPQEDQTLSLFSFEYTQVREGLNAIGPISVTVGDEKGQSPAATFTVTMKAPETGLQLRAFVLGEKPFYPGERLKFVYKIYFLGNVQLTKENLPLLDPEGFVKIGPLQVKDTEEKGYQVRTITQIVEAESPGTYTFDTSTLEGLINGIEKIQTTVEPFSLTIAPFPVETKPSGFIGTGGEFRVQSRLISSKNVIVGDKVLFEITFTGKGNLESLQLPDITCQPGVNGFFAPTETPTFATIDKDTKTFTVELIPMTDLRQEIPALKFSTYSSETEEYQTISRTKGDGTVS